MAADPGAPGHDIAIADYTEAIRLEPKYAGALNGRAWLYATCPDVRSRNGAQAVKDATRACELTEWKHANNLDTLAAAYAENGNFADAVKWQQQAIEQAPDSDKEDFRSRLRLYQAGKPYRQPPAGARAAAPEPPS